MRKTFATLILAVLSGAGSVNAQSKEGGCSKSCWFCRGFGGPEVRSAWIAGQPVVMVGTYGGWHLTPKFTLGGQGFNSLSTFFKGNEADGQTATNRIVLGYGGIWGQMEAVNLEKLRIAGTFLVGWGGGSLDNGVTGGGFMVTELGTAVDMPVNDHFAMGVTAGFRVMPIASRAFDPASQLAGPYAGFRLVFGNSASDSF